MQRYNINNRLAYLSGGVQSAGGMWPSAAAGDWWDIAGETCVAAYQPKGAASLSASYTNLANPGTYDLTLGSAPSFDTAAGWTFNGTSQYLKTGILPVNNQQWSMAIRFTGVTTNNGVIIGYQNSGGPFFGLEPIRLTSNVSYRNGYFLQVSTAFTSGVMAVAGATGYRDGVADAGTIAAYGGTFSGGSINIGANGGILGQYCNGTVVAAAIYSTTLDATQVATLSSAMAAL